MRFSVQAGLLNRARRLPQAHVIVCGNEKGGSGKSTTAIHLAIGLMKLGFPVATMDLDTRQQTLSRHTEYRHRFVQRGGGTIEIPTHLKLESGAEPAADETIAEYTEEFSDELKRLRFEADFIIIDTPGSYTPLSVAAHRHADTLVTPVNDSFVDLDVLAQIDPETYEIQEHAQYATAVRDARRMKQALGEGIIDWIVVRNRMSTLSSRNERRMEECLRELGVQLGFRFARGIGERVVFREFYQRGLSALDDTSDRPGGMVLTPSQMTARQEVRSLIDLLHLPIDERGLKRAEARRRWMTVDRPAVKVPDIFAD